MIFTPKKGANHGKTTSETPGKTVSSPKAAKEEADLTFQDQFADLEDTVGVAGTTMTATEANELVESGAGDTLAEHEPNVPPPEADPEKAPQRASHRQDDEPKSPKKEHDPFRD